MNNEHSYERLCDYYKAKQNKDMITKQKHPIGFRKQVKRFALFPMIIESRLVWLKRYILVKEYSMTMDYGDAFSVEKEPYFYWKNVERKIIRR